MEKTKSTVWDEVLAHYNLQRTDLPLLFSGIITAILLGAAVIFLLDRWTSFGLEEIRSIIAQSALYIFWGTFTITAVFGPRIRNLTLFFLGIFLGAIPVMLSFLFF